MAVFEWLWLIILIIVDVLWGVVSVMDIVKTIKFVADEKDREKQIRDFWYYLEEYSIVWVIINIIIFFLASLVCWGLQH